MEFITGGNKRQFEWFRLKLSLCILSWTLHFKAVRKLLPIFQSGGLLCRELFVMDGYLTLNEFPDSADRLSFPGVRWTVGTHRISKASGTKTHKHTLCIDTPYTDTPCTHSHACKKTCTHSHAHSLTHGHNYNNPGCNSPGLGRCQTPWRAPVVDKTSHYSKTMKLKENMRWPSEASVLY